MTEAMTSSDILAALDFDSEEDKPVLCNHPGHSKHRTISDEAALRYLFTCSDCTWSMERDVCFAMWGRLNRVNIRCRMCGALHGNRDEVLTVIRRYK